jgi:hypothetical protein
MIKRSAGGGFLGSTESCAIRVRQVSRLMLEVRNSCCDRYLTFSSSAGLSSAVTPQNAMLSREVFGLLHSRLEFPFLHIVERRMESTRCGL